MLYPQENVHRQINDLSGFWSFRTDPNDVGRENGWSAGVAGTRTIAVPASWNEQFQDLKHYFGSGWYQTEVYAPQHWRDRRIWLRVGSANYWADIWVNGEKIGAHAGGHLPFELDVTSAVAFGQRNTIIVRVNGTLSLETVPWGMVPDANVPRSVEQYPDINFDFFPYCGIHQPVVLYTTPATSIRDIATRTTLDDAGATLHVTVDTDADSAVQVRCTLRTPNEETPVATVQADASGDGKYRAELDVTEPRLWRPADPHLYDLDVQLVDGDTVLDEYRLPVGLRTVAVEGDQLLLNGRPIILHGFGKHEEFPIVGRREPAAVLVKDFELMRWCGANSFRTAHYRHSDATLRLADRLGLLVIAETPAVSLFFGEGDDERLAACRQQLRELIAADKNHPSIIMWSVANEPDSDVPPAIPFLKKLADLAHDLDETRPVTFVSHKGVADEAFTYFDVMCLNRYYGWYESPAQLDAACEQLSAEMDAMHAKFEKPLLLSEFGADATPGVRTHPPELFSEEFQAELLCRYLDTIDEKPYACGAHVWSFADFKTGQSFRRVGGINYKGVFTRDRQPKLAAHMLRERWKADDGN